MRKSLGVRTGAIALLALTPIVAQAQGWTGGQPGSFTGYNPFSLVGNVLTVTQGGGTYITSLGGGLSSNLLLGVRGIWLVDAAGNELTGLTTASGNGVSGFDWSVRNDGYVSENGFSPNRHWVRMQDGTVLAQYGKSGANDALTTGNFTFNPFPSTFAIGIDYLVADRPPTSPTAGNGTSKTGRVYFTIGGDDPRTGVPEPSEWAGMGVLATGLGMLVLRRRRKS